MTIEISHMGIESPCRKSQILSRTFVLIGVDKTVQVKPLKIMPDDMKKRAACIADIVMTAFPICFSRFSAVRINLQIGQPSPIHSWFAFAMIVINAARNKAMNRIRINNAIRLVQICRPVAPFFMVLSTLIPSFHSDFFIVFAS